MASVIEDDLEGRDKALEVARDLLGEGELAIKQIAWQMGYAHTNNFTIAFAQRFSSV